MAPQFVFKRRRGSRSSPPVFAPAGHVDPESAASFNSQLGHPFRWRHLVSRRDEPVRSMSDAEFDRLRVTEFLPVHWYIRWVAA